MRCLDVWPPTCKSGVQVRSGANLTMLSVRSRPAFTILEIITDAGLSISQAGHSRHRHTIHTSTLSRLEVEAIKRAQTHALPFSKTGTHHPFYIVQLIILTRRKLASSLFC